MTEPVTKPRATLRNLNLEADRLVPPRIYPKLNDTLKRRPADVRIARRVRLPHGVTEEMVFALAVRIGRHLLKAAPVERKTP